MKINVHLTRPHATILAAIGIFLSIAAITQSSPGQGIEKGIAWYGILQDGLSEAKASGKPILLVAAAPQCTGVSGMW